MLLLASVFASKINGLREQFVGFAFRCSFVFLLVITCLPTSSKAQGLLFTAYPTPAGSWDITAGPDGNLWFTTRNNAIGRITPSGVVTEFPLPVGSSSYEIARGRDGNLWFTDFNLNAIGRITPSGVVTEFPIPTSFSYPVGIAAGPDGNLWFTETIGKVGRITTSGVITEYMVPGGEALEIAVGQDGNLWFTEYDPNAIGRITPSGVVTEFPLPVGNSPRAITLGPDGNLWFTANSGGISVGSSLIGIVANITTAGAITEYQISLLGTLTQPGLVTGPDGNLWITEAMFSHLIKVTPAGLVTEIPTPVPSTERITLGPDGNLWYSSSSGSVVKVTLPPAASGTLLVTTNLPSATFTITGPATYSGGGLTSTQANVPPGVYTINFAAVIGYQTPLAQTFTVAASSTSSITGTYTIPYGTLNITVDAPGATIMVTGPAGFQGPGPLLTAAVPPGMYTIAAGAVLGYLTPSNQIIQLLAGQTLPIMIHYAPATSPGTINVQIKPPNLPVAEYSVTGPSSFSGEGSYSYTGQPPGEYTITFSPLVGPGITTPQPQTQRLLGGGQITFTGAYTSVTTPLSLTETFSDPISVRPFQIQVVYTGTRTSPTFVTANIIIPSVLQTWYELDFDASTGPPPQIPSDLMATVIGPSGAITLPNVIFGKGTVLRFTYSRFTPAALAMVAIDMICRGIFGQPFPANTSSGLDLQLAELSAVLSSNEAGFVGEASAIPLCKGDVTCIAGHLESLALDIVNDKQLQADLGPIITKVFGPDALRFITNKAAQDVLDAINLPATIISLYNLEQATNSAPLSGYFQVTAHN